ncbi:tryptophan permease, partial [Escherichia coli]
FKIDNSHAGRFKTVLLTFLPPALLYLIFPNGFIYGIGGAGLCATIWAVIIPAVLAIKARKKFPNQMFTVWGGNLIPAIVILFGITVILCWFGNVFNVLPKFG